MNRRDLNRAVARITGETVREITERGFDLQTRGPVERETLAVNDAPLEPATLEERQPQEASPPSCSEAC